MSDTHEQAPRLIGLQDIAHYSGLSEYDVIYVTGLPYREIQEGFSDEGIARRLGLLIKRVGSLVNGDPARIKEVLQTSIRELVLREVKKDRNQARRLLKDVSNVTAVDLQKTNDYASAIHITDIILGRSHISLKALTDELRGNKNSQKKPVPKR